MAREEPLTLDLFGGPEPSHDPAPTTPETGDAESDGEPAETDAAGPATRAETPTATPAETSAESPAPTSDQRSPQTSVETSDRTPDDESRVWTVSQVNTAVRRLLEGTLPTIWISGEVGGWKRARSGHCYFTLKDDRAQLRCVMFRTESARLPTDPDEGMEVRVQGNLTLYEARGEYQLVARRLEAGDAEGLWRLAFEKLRRKLEAEGLLAPERKRPIPRFPSCVGVVTSATGAAVRDVITVIRRRAPWTRVVVRGCRVQGEGASLEVAEALRCVARSRMVDLVIVGRGGGSVEDLWAFNEEPLARAIAESPVPVISAVGHEVDVTIADLVADLRAATPSAAAEAAVGDGRVLLEGLREIPPRLSRALRGGVQRRRTAVVDAGARLGRGIEAVISHRREAAAVGREAMGRGMQRTIEARRRRLGRGTAKLEALSPLSTLRRGYAVPLDDTGRVLRGVGEFPPGRRFELRVADGRVECEATDARPLDGLETLEDDRGG